MRARVAGLLILTCVWASAAGVVGAGDPDPTFGGTGMVTTSVDLRSFGEVILREPDDSLLLVGIASATLSFYGPRYVFLARYATDGTLDGSFGAGGVVTHPDGHDTLVGGAVLRPDGRVIVAAVRDYYTPSSSIVLLGFASDGSFDSTFGASGVVQLAGAYFPPPAVVLRPDGRIVTGASGVGAYYRIYQFLPDGTPDAAFGSGGVVDEPFPGSGFLLEDVLLTPAGKIVVTGETANGGIATRFIRYDQSGQRDPSFGSGGLVVGAPGTAGGIALQTDGKLLATGTRYLPGLARGPLVVSRFQDDGTADPGFGFDGMRLWDLGVSWPYGFQLLVEPDGRFVIRGVMGPDFGPFSWCSSGSLPTAASIHDSAPVESSYARTCGSPPCYSSRTASWSRSARPDLPRRRP